MKQHLRAVAEVAVLGSVAMSLPVLGMFASVPILNFLGGWGAFFGYLSLLVIIALYLLPLAAAFYYGYRRKLRLRLVAVWIGWVVGSFGSGALISVTLLRHAKLPHQPPLTPWAWANLSIWLASLLLPALVLALMTMLGQRFRLKRSR